MHNKHLNDLLLGRMFKVVPSNSLGCKQNGTSVINSPARVTYTRLNFVKNTLSECQIINT